MSYLVLARKWRPQAFADMTGQEHVVRTLANAIAQDRVAHAYLFCGPRGVGKTTAARLLAKALNCEKGPTATPCGVCPACTDITAGSSVDVIEVDGASNNGVENVREIRETARYMPQRDRHKVFIIDEVHMLTGAAFNALLKTLEEPPPHVKFIFATTEPHKLPDTILSRCQRHNFRRIPTAMMLARLREILAAEKAQLGDRSLALVARQSEGGMRDALSLLDQILSACGSNPTDEAVSEAIGAVDRTQVHRLVVGLVKRDAKLALAAVEEVHIRGTDIRRLADEAALHLRHLLVARVTGEPPEELGESERTALMELAKGADVAQLARLFDLVHGAIGEIGRAAQPRLAFEVALMKAVHLAPGAGIETLSRQLEQVAQQLVKGGTQAASPGRSFRSPALNEAPPPAPRELRSEPPPPIALAPPPPAEPPQAKPSGERTFTVDASPEGCATGECLPDIQAELARKGISLPTQAPAVAAAPPAPVVVAAPTPTPAPATGPLPGVSRDRPQSPLADRWRAVVDGLRGPQPRLADSLAHARPLSIEADSVRITFTGPRAAFQQSQVAQKRAEVEALLAKHFGRPMALKVEEGGEGLQAAPLSPAEDAAARRASREERIRTETAAHPAVVAAMKVLGGRLQDVRVREEIPRPLVQDDFTEDS